MSTNCLSVRKSYLDFLRILAIILVLFNHTAAFRYPFSHPCTTPQDFCYLVISICDKIAVPLFFMISGALLLHKEESFKRLWKHRILRFFIIIGAYQILQHVYGYFISNHPITIPYFLENCLFGKMCNAKNGAVWFLYAYLVFLLMLPFLRLLVKQMSNAHFLYLFAIQLIFAAFIPCENTACTEFLILCNNVYLYVLAGYYVEHKINVSHLICKYKLFLIFASIICVLLGGAMCEVDRIIIGAKNIRHETLAFKGCLLIPCITVFLLVKSRMANIKSAKWEHILSVLGGAVFSIMLFENILRHVAKYCILQHLSSSYMSDVLIVILACCIGFPIGILLQKIPGINKFL